MCDLWVHMPTSQVIYTTAVLIVGINMAAAASSDGTTCKTGPGVLPALDWCAADEALLAASAKAMHTVEDLNEALNCRSKEALTVLRLCKEGKASLCSRCRDHTAVVTGLDAAVIQDDLRSSQNAQISQF